MPCHGNEVKAAEDDVVQDMQSGRVCYLLAVF
jgi:hypothetical protein